MDANPGGALFKGDEAFGIGGSFGNGSEDDAVEAIDAGDGGVDCEWACREAENEECRLVESTGEMAVCLLYTSDAADE